ncbi:MAG: nickel pincer cofactor biosynthesis protein LarC [Thermodesulfovibrionales bacterium]|nr:nickel pincer cofactor biosynthesis protein LarC [Thermodesulfovibrionales bacterium]
MKIAYFDCSSGISGDMCLGALIDAGVPVKKLENELRKLRVKGYSLEVKRVKRSGLEETKADVITGARGKGQGARRWKDIEHLIKNSQLSDEIKKKGLSIFRRLLTAEAKVHGETFNTAHLHELGAVDCIVDIFGTVIGLKLLGIEKVYSSGVNIGGGSIRTKHGILPVPAPATAELLKGIPVYSDNPDYELTTPTGAVILKEISSSFGSTPDMVIEKIGIGAGNKDFKDKPNVLRILIGNPPSLPFTKGGMGEFSDEKVTVIETTIDDMNPQIYEYVMERLFKAGALDVYLTQLIMKKGRPGIKLTVLCNSNEKEKMMKIIFEETTTIGLRFYEAGRQTLEREIKEINTALGKVKIKVSKLGSDIIKITPEYEDCKKLAKKLNMPLIEVMERVKSQRKS